MFSNSELVFAQHYPFSSSAKQVLKKQAFELNQTPEGVIGRAALMLSAAAKGKSYVQEHLVHSPDLLVQEIQAFPIAKILVSAIDRPDLWDRFAELVANNTFFYLTNAKNRRETLLELASDLKVKFELHNSELFLVRIPVDSFLQAGFKEDFMKLVNQPIEKGLVFLPENDFARFLSEMAREKTRDSLPVALPSIPKNLVEVARQLKEQLVHRQKKAFSFALAGKLDPNAFPPCIAKIYANLLEGKNVGHAARFNVATFLVAIGFAPGQIVELFKKTPNFNEKVTRYQVERIAGRGKARYAPSSCAKIRSYNLCLAHCPVSHPLQFYERELKKTSPQKTNSVVQK
ncbi:hypothetical protein KKE06_05295 [Candidatus Micrarchaeota archaeon]|nr:hypothetical protein [Candidatus Micrarchaeota archaeon]MBU1929955.1 hypothetical protein [Candidatus Micrarchaeota archaeon]